ncbi:hypothetical protein GCM10009540_20250 [Streptomyces turgidiscabies]
MTVSALLAATAPKLAAPNGPLPVDSAAARDAAPSPNNPPAATAPPASIRRRDGPRGLGAGPTDGAAMPRGKPPAGCGTGSLADCRAEDEAVSGGGFPAPDRIAPPAPACAGLAESARTGAPSRLASNARPRSPPNCPPPSPRNSEPRPLPDDSLPRLSTNP